MNPNRIHSIRDYRGTHDSSQSTRKLLHKAQTFFENTSAHGFDKACSNKMPVLGRLFWSIVLLISFSGLFWTVNKRIRNYQIAMNDTTFRSEGSDAV